MKLVSELPVALALTQIEKEVIEKLVSDKVILPVSEWGWTECEVIEK